MHCGITCTFHEDNFHKWLDPHAYKALKNFSLGNYFQIDENCENVPPQNNLLYGMC